MEKLRGRPWNHPSESFFGGKTYGDVTGTPVEPPFGVVFGGKTYGEVTGTSVEPLLSQLSRLGTIKGAIFPHLSFSKKFHH